jgi:hypothetical protein
MIDASVTTAALIAIASHPVVKICPSSRTHASAGAAIETKMIRPNKVRGYRFGTAPATRRAATASMRTSMMRVEISIHIQVSSTPNCGLRRPPNAATTIATPGKSENQSTKSHTTSTRPGFAPVRARHARRLPSTSFTASILSRSARRPTVTPVGRSGEGPARERRAPQPRSLGARAHRVEKYLDSTCGLVPTSARRAGAG